MFFKCSQAEFHLAGVENLLALPDEQGGHPMRQLALAGLFVLAATPAALAEPHRIVLHIDQNDPQVMNMTLNNVENLTRYYHDQGEDVVAEIVAYGPGLTMLIPDKSPVADRIATMALEMEDLKFSACGNTRRAMSEKAGHEVQLLDEAQEVPSGVVRLVELQEQGYAYVRP
jgi:hypothetical protein